MNNLSKLNKIESIILKNNDSLTGKPGKIIETFGKHFEFRYQNE